MRFNPPPNWPPVPQGWTPPAGWRPPTEWGEPPYGWQLWVPAEHTTHPRSGPESHTRQASTQTLSAPPPDQEPPKTGRWGRATRKAVENPLWTTLGAIVGIIGLVVSVIQIVQATRTPPVDLEIAALTIDGRQSVAAQIFSGRSNDDPADGTIELTPIELTLQNKGGDPSLITRIDARVVYFEQLQDCTGARPATDSAAGQYQLSIPMNGPAPSSEILQNEIRFEVKPNAADRMIVTLGPAMQPAYATTPMVMSVELGLVHDDDQTKDIGTVSLVTTVDAAEAQVSGIGTTRQARECAKANTEQLDTMFAIQATRSRLLDQLRSAYKSAGA